MSALEDLQPNAAVRGILPDGLVTVVSVKWFGSEALELTYKNSAGRVANELLFRFALDHLTHLHCAPLLGQLPPAQLFARVYTLLDDPIEIDLSRIRADIEVRQPRQDIVFSLRIIAVARDGTAAETFLVPWTDLQDTHLRKSRAELAGYLVPLPTDVDLVSAASAMFGIY